MPEQLAFTVLGIATPKGSMKSFVARRKDGSMVMSAPNRPKVITHDHQGVHGKVWAVKVSNAAAVAMGNAGLELLRAVPMDVEIDFYLPRPKNHYRTGRFANELRDSAPAVPHTMPDVDKLIRGVLDALTNIVYGDDGQVVRAVGNKRFGDPARAEIRIARHVEYDEEAFLTHSSTAQLSLTRADIAAAYDVPEQLLGEDLFR